ncbi:MAG TPA: LysR family transcriptional regulator [Steroidobacteraceae bacterium]|jgi:DNA-binding transcriptional LysR family regulator|nr:LysR family transcriptional regulator [Steroidobacteraceae bacterium]
MSIRDFEAALPDLHMLTVIAETRSLTQTARRLGVAKSSVSIRLKDLERLIGMSLVRRTTRSVTLTAAGQQLVEETRASFVHIERGISGVKDLAGAPRGLVRMTAPVALGRQHIAPVIPALLERFPELRLELDLSDRFVNLTQEGFDVAVRHASRVPDSHVATVLCETRALLLASPKYLARRGVPAHPSELASHDCLLYLRDGGAPSWSFERLDGRARVAERVSVPVGGPLRANNSEVLREAAAAGMGVGMLPDFTAWSGAQSRALVPVLPQWRPAGFFGERLQAIRPWSPRTPRAVQCVIDHLREAFSHGFVARP